MFACGDAVALHTKRVVEHDFGVYVLYSKSIHFLFKPADCRQVVSSWRECSVADQVQIQKFRSRNPLH